MATQRGGPCPICGKYLTTHVALLPFKGVEPHKYAVCPDCWCKQWALSEGEDVPCPLADYLRTPVDSPPEEEPPEEEPSPPELTKELTEVPVPELTEGA